MIELHVVVFHLVLLLRIHMKRNVLPVSPSFLLQTLKHLRLLVCAPIDRKERELHVIYDTIIMRILVLLYLHSHRPTLDAKVQFRFAFCTSNSHRIRDVLLAIIARILQFTQYFSQNVRFNSNGFRSDVTTEMQKKPSAKIREIRIPNLRFSRNSGGQ